MKVITADGRKENPIKPHLLIKLSNPIRDYQEFQNKDILENIIQGSQISTKQNPSSTNGTFLKTAKEILTANGGDLSVSVLEKDNSNKSAEFQVTIKFPLEKSSEI